MKVESNLCRNQENEVCSDVHHSSLDDFLAWSGSPGWGVCGVGMVQTGLALLLGVRRQKPLHIPTAHVNGWKLGLIKHCSVVAVDVSHDLNSHVGGHQGSVDWRNIYSGEEVSIHVVHSTDVVNVSGVVEQVARVIRQEVAIDHGRQEQVFYDGV